MILIKCGKYILREWKKGDFPPPGINVGSYALDEYGVQVGAACTIADNILKDIGTKPKGRGHGTKLIELLMKRAKLLGYNVFRVESVTGHGSTSQEKKLNRRKMESILKKLNFLQVNKIENHWEKDLRNFDISKVEC